MKDTLRILHIFNEYLNITENWAFRLIDHLPDAKVVIASKRFLPCNFYSKKFDYLKFPLKTVRNPKRVFGLRVFNRFIFELLRVYPWFVKRTCEKCDLMHSHFAMVGWEYMKLAKRMRIPHIVSFYGFDYEYMPFKQAIWKHRYRRLFQEADLFLCEGSNGFQILRKIGCPSEKIKVAHLGVDVECIPFWKRQKKPAELHLLQAATFIEKKRAEILSRSIYDNLTKLSQHDADVCRC